LFGGSFLFFPLDFLGFLLFLLGRLGRGFGLLNLSNLFLGGTSLFLWGYQYSEHGVVWRTVEWTMVNIEVCTAV
jgi:hypothetical protein